MPAWDTLTVLALLFTALVTPYEVALLEPPVSWSAAARDVLFIVNRIVDLVFLFDMFVQFLLMVQVGAARQPSPGAAMGPQTKRLLPRPLAQHVDAAVPVGGA